MTKLPDAKLFIDGQLRDATGGRTFDVISPWTGEAIGKAADATAEDVEAAIVAARRAFDETDWGSPENRQTRFELVKKYRELFEKNRAADVTVDAVQSVLLEEAAKLGRESGVRGGPGRDRLAAQSAGEPGNH